MVLELYDYQEVEEWNHRRRELDAQNHARLQGFLFEQKQQTESVLAELQPQGMEGSSEPNRVRHLVTVGPQLTPSAINRFIR